MRSNNSDASRAGRRALERQHSLGSSFFATRSALMQGLAVDPVIRHTIEQMSSLLGELRHLIPDDDEEPRFLPVLDLDRYGFTHPKLVRCFLGYPGDYDEVTRYRAFAMRSVAEALPRPETAQD